MARRRTLEDLKEDAHRVGGVCLSEVYLGAHEKHEWKCAKGHAWMATANSVRVGRWCSECNRGKRRTIEEIRKVATELGGEFLSSEYFGVDYYYDWRCSGGHIWRANADSVLRGHWCATCAGISKHDISFLQEWAIKKGGCLVSNSYENLKIRLEWECSEGHRWKAKGNNVVNMGQWCPFCSGLAGITIDTLRLAAEEKRGKCLSIEYTGVHSIYDWECSEGHRWSASGTDIRRDHWCPECSGLKKKTLSDARQMALEKGGKCLADEFVNAASKYLWECSKGHRWSTTYCAIQQGGWCPLCAKQSSGFETSILSVVQNIGLGVVVHKQRGLLKTKSFELDIWIPEFKVGIECDGEFWHHSDWSRKHGSENRDARKNEQCRAVGINLIRVRENDWPVCKAELIERVEALCRKTA